MCILSRQGGSNNVFFSYGGSKRGGVCEIACAHFSYELADRRDLKLCTMLHYHYTVACWKGEFNNFSLSYGECKRGRDVKYLVLTSPLKMANHGDLKLCTMLHYH
jgi:hypothetical protein